MGSTIRDFLYPEFILFGVDDEKAAKKAQDFYKTICDSPFYKTTICLLYTSPSPRDRG